MLGKTTTSHNPAQAQLSESHVVFLALRPRTLLEVFFIEARPAYVRVGTSVKPWMGL